MGSMFCSKRTECHHLALLLSFCAWGKRGKPVKAAERTAPLRRQDLSQGKTGWDIKSSYGTVSLVRLGKILRRETSQAVFER